MITICISFKGMHAVTKFLSGGEEMEFIKSTKVQIDDQQFSSGATAKVCKGIYTDNKEQVHQVAVKEFNAQMNRRMQRKVNKEAKFLKTLSHPNVLRFYGVIEGSSKIVTEYLEKVIVIENEQVPINNLRQLLDELEESVPWSVRLDIALKTAKGLQYLHNSECIHCDLKSANIFLSSEPENQWIIKIGDFEEAISEWQEYMVTQLSSQDPSTMAAGTIPYMAPEVLTGGKPTKSSDIYSFAMLLVELLCPRRNNPWSNDCKSFCITQYVLEQKRPSLPVKCDELTGTQWAKLQDLIQRCWSNKPSQRPTVEEIIRKLEEIASPKDDSMESKKSSFGDGVHSECPSYNEMPNVVHLSLHQGFAMEDFGAISASFLQSSDLPQDLIVDMEKQAKESDGTNACAFFSAAISNWLEVNGQSYLFNDLPEVRDAVKRIIMEVPKKINCLRDVSSFFTTEDAVEIMRVANLYDLETEPIWNCFAGVETEEGEKALLDMFTLLHERRPVSAVFTCQPYSFCVGCLTSKEGKKRFYNSRHTQCIGESRWQW